MRYKKKVITIGAFDLAKGMGMFCIVAGHTIFNYDVPFTAVSTGLKIFGTGLMPMFFLISGFGCKGTEEKKYLKKTVKELLIPYFFVTAAAAVLFPVLHFLMFRWWPGTWDETKKIVLAYLTGCSKSGRVFLGSELYECSVVWFLLALFWSSNILNLILKRISGRVQIIAVLVCVAAGAGCLAGDIWMFCIPQGLLSVGYLYLGYLMKKTGWLEKKLPVWQKLLLAGISGAEVVWGGINLAYGIFRRGALDYFGAGLAGILMIRVTLWFNRYDGVFLEKIRKVGRYSYYAMCVHSVEMNCIPWYLFASCFARFPYAGYFFQIFVRGTIIWAGCMVLNKISARKRRTLQPGGGSC